MDLGSNREGSSPVALSAAAAAAIRDAVRQSGHIEACGLLLGEPGRIATATVARNVAAEPTHRFEIDPAHLFDQHRQARTGPHAIIGCWHSHPNGRAEPSKTDRTGVSDESWLWLIATADGLTLWRPVHEGFTPVAIAATDL
ncbi:MAG: hypothetical protein DI568_10485 [Sphingomonas sp.]|nr:MAG: hypothetical protein DI568_10485 [Sphingomonas sp.]